MNALTMVNVDRAAWLVGREAAEELDRQGLIRHDAWQAPMPTHYILRVTLGKGPYKTDVWMRSELRDVLNHAMGISWKHSIPKSSATLTYQRKGPAELQAKKARDCGLAAELIPCILMPVNNVG